MRPFRLLLAIYCSSSVLSPGATFTVTTTNHSDAGSLRQAILDANANPGPDQIAFNIVSAGKTITPTNALPAITEALTIDGTTQPGFANAPIIELNGQIAGTGADGLRLWSGGTVIRGLVINRFNGDGIEVATNGNNAIEGCIIGLNVAGTIDQGNNASGIFITNSPNNRIGGTTAAQRNVISGNQQNGVLIQGLAGSNNVVQGNLIGLNATGGVAIANSVNGIFLNGSPANAIGGSAGGNVISGNSQSGIRLEGTNAYQNLIEGNIIGLDPAGLVDLGNGQQGVYLLNAPTNTVGGTTVGARNVISGNNQAGVRFDSASARGNRILGNFIGTDASGQFARGNSAEGVGGANNASFNSIGGINSGEANLIAFNSGDGVFLSTGTNNVARGNAIHSNNGLGIDLGADGKLNNDAGDPDTGANQQQNYPVLGAATNTPAGVFVSGTLNSRPSASYLLDFYSNVLPDFSTNGEGQAYLGSINVTTGADSNAVFAVTLSPAVGRWISATATDMNGNTSEFSTSVRAESTVAAQTFAVVNTNDSGPGSLRQALTQVNNTPAVASHLVRFAIPGSGTRTITLLSDLPTILEPVVIDGFTQAGSSSNTLATGNNAVWLVRLDGNNSGAVTDGLVLRGSNNVVRGLIITRFLGDGLQLFIGGNNVIVGNCIGLDETGADQGNGANGVFVSDSPGNRIGGASPGDRNVISGNGGNGVEMNGPGATQNRVLGNYIGPDPGGTLDRRNNANGVFVSSAAHNTIGGAATGEGNLLVHNLSEGVEINGLNATNNVVLGNLIGTDSSGTANLANIGAGILLTSNARFNVIGATNSGAGNRIAFNFTDGIYVQSGSNNAIRGNDIWVNGTLGIDLGNNDVTANDAGDSDTGANQLQNFPLITGGTLHPASVQIAGTLNSRPNGDYTLDFFANLVCDDSGNGEGQQYLGSANVTTDGSGNAAFNVTFSVTAMGRFLTATATDTNGNSSEFSACFSAASTLPPMTLTVVNTNDAGAGSLRQALLDADSFPSGSPNIIAFNIPGAGPHTIAPLTQLPTNREPVFIDGYSQPGANTNALANGFNGTLRIRIDGARMSGFGTVAMRLQSGGNVVRGLAFTTWGNRNAIEISRGGSNVVAGCLIGIDTDGSDKHAGIGVLITDSAGNAVGGLSAGDRNIISYNFSHAIHIQGQDASNNVVAGNFIGTDFTGTLKRANAIDGVRIDDGSYNLIGGTAPGARNLISGNSDGVAITSPTPGAARGNVVQGNLIGTDVTGTIALGNASDGITTGGAGTIIGGATAAARNIIGGSGQFGIDLATGPGGAAVLGNWIGVGHGGNALTNGAQGIIISSSSNRIGGIVAGEGNVVAYGRSHGVVVTEFFTAIANAIRGNSIYANHSTFQPALGIDLGFNGVTANDVADGDSGANHRQNFPIITSASGNASSTTVGGTLNSSASQTYQLDFFANTTCDPSGNGEGQFYLGTANVNTDGSGNGSFNATLPVGASGRFITATATDAQGNSSEFSTCFEASVSIAPMTFTVVNTNDSGAGSLRQAILDSNGHVSSQNNTIAFNVPGAGIHSIKLLSPLPPFTQPVTIDGFTQPGSSANTLPNGNNASWLIELRGVGAQFSEETLRLNIAGLIVRGLRLTGSAGVAAELVSSNCVVTGCFIFSNAAGGILITSAHGNRIGGTAPADRNIISGHGSSRAIEISEGNNNLVLGNLIGPAPDGTSALGIGQFDGVSIFNGSGNVIGDGTAGGGNIIAFHQSDAVTIQSGTNNSVRGNSIFSNAFPIDLTPDGVTANDAGDADGGANHLQNFPTITNAVANTGATVIQGRLNSRANTTYTLDFFASTACHFSGNGEGEFYLGSANVTADGSGNVNFNVTLPVTAPRATLTATATDPSGNTSEFSPCRAATINLPGQTYTVINTNDSGPGSLRQVMLDSALVPNTGADRVHFNIPGAGPHRINLLSGLPVPTEPLIIDGYTQPGASPNTSSDADNAVLKIQLDGSLAGGHSALGITNAGNTIRGLSFTRFTSDAIFISGPSNLFAGNWVGVAPSGAGGSNASAGVTIVSSFNMIGGTNPAARNIIAANEDGILISGPSASNNVVAGNFIGVAPSGTNALGNTDDGVLILGGASWNTIGDLSNPGAENVIGFNGEDGVSVDFGRQNGIFGNRMCCNGQKNIFVAPGANDGVQPPQVIHAYLGSLVVEGEFFNSLPNREYIVSVYIRDDTPAGLVFPKIAQRYLGSFPVTTDMNGKGRYRRTFEDVPGLGLADHVETTLTCENNTSEESNTARVVPGTSADLKIAMEPPTSPVQLGHTVFYLVIVTNCGPGTATNVCLQQALPPGLRIVNATSLDGTCAFSNGTATCKVATLAEGRTAQFVVSAIADAPGSMVTTARVSSDQPDAFPSNNIVTRDIIVRGSGTPVDVGVSTSVSQTAATPGTEVEVTTVVFNNSQNVANGVVLRQSLPPGTELISASLVSSFEDGFLTSEIGSLAPGQRTNITMRVKMGTFGPTTVLEFGSAVFRTGSDFFPGNDVSTAAVALQMPELGIGWNGLFPVISWPGPTPGVQLEYTEDLELAEWLGVEPELISFLNGYHEYQPDVPGGEGQAFYRLGPTNLLTLLVQIYQLSLIYDLVQVPFSDWGRVDVTFIPRAGVVQFFNLSLPCSESFPALAGLRAAGEQGQSNGVCWVVENVPLITNQPTNRATTVSINFPLNSNGVPITAASLGYSVTTNMLRTPPPIANSLRFAPSLSVMYSGTANQLTTWRPARPLAAGPIAGLFTAKPNFWSTEQGPRECAPAAVMDSLSYLKRNFPLRNLPWGEITLQKMKEATGWTPAGAAAGFLGIGTWADLKDTYMQDRNFPIVTTQTSDMTQVITALTNCCDVEIWYEGHVAAVVAIADIGNGDYALTLSHDIQQGRLGGVVREIVIFDSEAGEVYGSTWGRDFVEFVIECPAP